MLVKIKCGRTKYFNKFAKAICRKKCYLYRIHVPCPTKIECIFNYIGTTSDYIATNDDSILRLPEC